MRANIDFTLIFTLLAMVGLFIMNIKVKPEKDNSEQSIQEMQQKDEELVLVVHRANGDEKKYHQKTTVA